MNVPVALGVAAVTMGVLDGVWLAVVAKSFYRTQLGPILRRKFDGVAAGLFYVLYVIGVVALAVGPADSVANAALRGAVLGLVAYGTYDLTNRATVTPFPWRLALVDMTWGTVLTAIVAAVTEAVAGS